MTEQNPGPVAPRGLNPLWIISLFLGVAETTTGTAATLASGWIQGVLAIFAVTFPLLVSGSFFAILWRKPEVLYAPRDFPEHVPVESYVNGMRRGTIGNVELVETAVRETLRSVVPDALEGSATPSEVSRVVDRAISVAHREIASRVLTITLDPAIHGMPAGAPETRLEFAVTDRTLVQDILDPVWAMMSNAVGAYTYGEQWVLMDRRTGRTLRADLNSGPQWDLRNTEGDELRLRDLGIGAASELVVVLLQPARSASLTAASV
ncbi:hypothetical protein ABZ511_03825 [Nocardia gamkensis]|uniref:hypothetical protein n=1 Tax=Nocardia gamkensis TaxID=352869 RepID=UPI0033C718D3